MLSSFISIKKIYSSRTLLIRHTSNVFIKGDGESYKEFLSVK